MNLHNTVSNYATVLTLCALLILGALGATIKLQTLGTTHSGDYENYVVTARYMAGESVEAETISIAGRLLKPLYPATLAVLRPYMEFKTAALLQTVIFYLLFIVAMFLLAKEFFKSTYLAVITVLLSAFSYPVLKYGIDVYSETGAWAMYVFSLWLTLKFVQHPSVRIFAANVALITIGFLWKEYIVVAGMIFGLTLLFHSAITIRTKAVYVAWYVLAFLAVHISWQIYVFRLFDFSYLDWYLEAGADGFSYEFTLKNIVKSTAALIGLMWLLVPHGLLRIHSGAGYQRFFAWISAPVPFIGYLWGFISSRLLYVIAPPMLLIAVSGMREWSRAAQIAMVAIALLGNIGWLVLSYRVTL